MQALVECPDPDCGVVAEIVDTVVMGSTGGPFELVRTLCVRQHTYDFPAERLILLETVDRAAAAFRPQ